MTESHSPRNPNNNTTAQSPFTRLSRIAEDFLMQDHERNIDMRSLLQESVDTLANYHDECKKLKKYHNHTRNKSQSSANDDEDLYTLYESAYIYYKIVHILISTTIPSLKNFSEIKSMNANDHEKEMFQIYNMLVKSLSNDEYILTIKNFIRNYSNKDMEFKPITDNNKNIDVFPKTGSHITSSVLATILQTDPDSTLLIDVRTRHDFELNHIKSNSIICIEPISFKNNYSDVDIERKSLITSPNSEIEIFKNRENYKFIILYTDDSRPTNQFNNNSNSNVTNDFYIHKLNVLFNILLNHSVAKNLNSNLNHVYYLEGGIQNWIKNGGPLLKSEKINNHLNSGENYYLTSSSNHDFKIDSSNYNKENKHSLSLSPKITPMNMDQSMKDMMLSPNGNPSYHLNNNSYDSRTQQKPVSINKNPSIKNFVNSSFKSNSTTSTPNNNTNSINSRSPTSLPSAKYPNISPQINQFSRLYSSFPDTVSNERNNTMSPEFSRNQSGTFSPNPTPLNPSLTNNSTSGLTSYPEAPNILTNGNNSNIPSRPITQVSPINTRAVTPNSKNYISQAQHLLMTNSQPNLQTSLINEQQNQLTSNNNHSSNNKNPSSQPMIPSKPTLLKAKQLPSPSNNSIHNRSNYQSNSMANSAAASAMASPSSRTPSQPIPALPKMPPKPKSLSGTNFDTRARSSSYGSSQQLHYPTSNSSSNQNNGLTHHPNNTTMTISQSSNGYTPDLDLDFKVGLENMGNSCYLNCIIQCLLNNHELTKMFLNNSYEKHININSKLGSKGILAKSFARLVHSMYQNGTLSIKNHSNKKNPPVQPITFKTACGSINSLFKGSNQQDCQEFCQFLLDGLHEDLNQCGANPPLKELSTEAERMREKLSLRIASSIEWERFLTTDFSVIIDLYQGQYASQLKCQVCGTTSTTYQTFSVLSVPVPKNKSIHLLDCFNEFTKTEFLGKDELWSCTECKKKQPSTKTLTITRLPKNLIIHLKRFDNMLHKNNVFVKYPLILDLTNYWANDFDGKLPPGVTEELPARGQIPPFKYELSGVALHMGSLYGGHYTAYVNKGLKNGWYYFDDTVYRSIKYSSEMITQNAYVLFIIEYMAFKRYESLTTQPIIEILIFYLITFLFYRINAFKKTFFNIIYELFF
ncbi:hypothetical protein TBLA_0F03610 [Henningerozyma blattae CBS 6284]|uniref:ubiquitinyl hydrolase 1 n=1 Tax=Henningerozyma blattae (strain ATCC 34711 / CBS 6284 / DSM 70876 / NBRC 10599 / NRRL Y-10934 / UCD 77-7) TaxID=1071380 RepID=I2H696_HENB6|nr:hypothetical protein TBLA_0F03610 [Tetrapisispora blattae CBS 6284]CCH61898.1 hypothetical protein TBLA_0F03610 [Tetrapisispora blattae CBS 6284]